MKNIDRAVIMVSLNDKWEELAKLMPHLSPEVLKEYKKAYIEGAFVALQKVVGSDDPTQTIARTVVGHMQQFQSMQRNVSAALSEVLTMREEIK